MIHVTGNVYFEGVDRGIIMLCDRNRNGIYYYSKQAQEARQILRKRKIIIKKRKHSYVHVMSDYGKAMMKLMS